MIDNKVNLIIHLITVSLDSKMSKSMSKKKAQFQILETLITKNNFKAPIDRQTKNLLAVESNLSYKQVSNWFRNKRRMQKNVHKNNKNSVASEKKKILNDFFFNTNQRPSREERAKLSKITKLKTLEIKKWNYKQIII
ncbi:hypothetical protein BpHYR1_046266 [Brachionus plicatilis]|uniref:Homeobox domain-containing protein n=1 Tax=Brachionus plicatilis TaxID=10195 RepID=A0A3M7SFU3_BRAPC|nr:hypothetical protein BpHYR1_046266 [Brachionus plicatilis]